MSNTTYTSMLVCWKEQRRLIRIKIDDDYNSIEKLVIESYQLEKFDHFQEYQIQYYDETYKTFVDLSSQTMECFQKLVEKLLSPNAPTKDHSVWQLRIILKATAIIRDAFRDQTGTDACKYDDEESINTQIDDAALSSHSGRSNINTEDLHKAGTLQIDHGNATSDNPLHFHFANDIADRQRKQYESDIDRKRRSNNSSIGGGVFLRASTLNSTSSYPTLQFQIPENKFHSSWSLYLYILTESDSNGRYYLHASKGIYDGLTMVKDKFGPIPNSTLVNPHKIELSEWDIRQGKFEIRLRVCNLRNLPHHKHEKLRKFPEFHRFMIYDDTDLISQWTTASLKFNSEKYHLGCILVCDYRVQDRCVSHLATDDHKRKRKS